MHESTKSKSPWWIVGALGAVIALVFASLQLVGNASPQAVPADQPGSGQDVNCALDSLSGCTIQHSFGVKPVVTATSAKVDAYVSVNPANTTTGQYRISYRRHDGTLYATDGRIIVTSVHFDFPPAVTPPPTTTAPPPPTTSTPPVTTPPTTATPTPTPSPGPSPIKSCTNGQTISEGAGASYFEPDGSEYFVHNNNWNDNYGGSHTITACNYDNWYLTTNIPAHGDNAVEAYPNVHRDYNNKPLSGITSARFAAKAPTCTSALKYNVAFDIWIGSGFNNELMIWTENCNQRPAGNQVGTTVIGGQTYEVWKSGAGAGGIFSYVATPRQLFGTMPLNLFWDDLNRRGWINGTQTTWQVDFGVETVYTSGTTQRFDFTDFYINDTAGSTAVASTKEKAAKLHLHKLGVDRRN